MTREEAQQRINELERRRNALVDQLTEVDATSATVSASSGSRSYTNRSVDDIKKKIRACEREIVRIGAQFGLCPPPGQIRTIYARFDG